MAFRSNGPVTLSLPPFRGVTRRIILTALIVYFGIGLLGIVLPKLALTLRDLAVLVPDLALRGELWMFLSYPFMGAGLLSVGFALLSIWFFGSTLEDERGGRWLMEYFLATTIGGGLLASLLAVALGPGNRFIPYAATAGLWPFVLATLIAFAYFHSDQELRFNFILTLKAKYLAAIYVLGYLALSLSEAERFGTVVVLLSALCGFLFLRFAPRKGVRGGVSERWYGLRNAYYRAKRKRSAKKFVVYMKKQGKEVSLDEDGQYVEPDVRGRLSGRDPNDRRWMN